MPPKKTEAQKQADKAKKNQQLQLKRELVKENKQKELIKKYGNNRFTGTIAFNVPKLVYYDKNGNFKAIDPLTKANNIKKINKKPVVKLIQTMKSYPYIDDTEQTAEKDKRIKLNRNLLILQAKITDIEKKFNKNVDGLSSKSKLYQKLLKDKNEDIETVKSKMRYPRNNN